MDRVNDDWLKNGLPTYQGEKDSAVGRKMIDRLGGPVGFKTDYRTNADGSVTTVQLKGDMPPEIRTTRGSINNPVYKCSLEMDSGIMDIIGYGPSDHKTMLHGKVYRTNYVSANVSGKTTAVGAGKLNYPSPTGPVVEQGADAKAPADRKVLAMKIPASLFTGRMRLYVQSLFGSSWSELVLGDGSGGIGRPMLSVNTVSREGNKLVAVNIGSGCGLFFDNTTKRHWLILPTEAQAIIIPLQGSPCAERYRTLLFSETLSDEDKEKVEAYILSQSYPVPEFSTFLSYESTPSEGLGYSWHFNWDGDKCDIVDVAEVFIPGPGVYGFTSTHYRLTFTLNGLNMSVSRSVVKVSPPWSQPKNTNVIAYPTWDGLTVKAGNLPSKLYGVGGRVYVFYERNTLRTVDVAIDLNRPPENKLECSPYYYGGDNYARLDLPRTLATEESGYRKASTTTYSGRAVTTCSGYSVGAAYMSSATGVEDIEDWWGFRFTYQMSTGNEEKDPANWNRWWWWGNPYTVTGTYPYNLTVTYTMRTPQYAHNVWWQTQAEWIYKFNNFSSGNSVSTLCLIPFYNAEAVYLTDREIEVTTRTWGGQYTSLRGALTNMNGDQQPDVSDSRQSYYNSSDDPNRKEGWSTTDEVVSLGQPVLVTSAGAFQAQTIPNLGTLWSTEKSTSQMYATLASANGVVNAPDTGVQSGSPIFPHLSAYLGWA